MAPPAAVAMGGRHPDKIKDAHLRSIGWVYEGGDGGGNEEMRDMMIEMMKMMIARTDCMLVRFDNVLVRFENALSRFENKNDGNAKEPTVESWSVCSEVNMSGHDSSNDDAADAVAEVDDVNNDVDDDVERFEIFTQPSTPRPGLNHQGQDTAESATAQTPTAPNEPGSSADLAATAADQPTPPPRTTAVPAASATAHDSPDATGTASPWWLDQRAPCKHQVCFFNW